MSKTNELEEIQQTLQQIFLNNLNFLKQNNKNLYERLVAFEKLNIENYSIEFIDNRFELIDIKNKTSFYNKDPFIDAKNRVNNFEFSNAFSLIKLEPYEKRNHYENEINAYLYINDFINNFANTSTEINKFVFIGTLLGVHINDFHNSINSKSYLIIESNIEIFRLSMFMTDYTTLAKSSKLFFAIAEDEFNFQKIVNDFLEYKEEFNNLIHYELGDESNRAIIDRLSLQFTQSSQMRYPFSEYLISLKRGFKYFLESKNKIINLSKNYDFLEKKKVLFLGAGVSLARNIEWLYTNQNKFVIVASSAVLKHLQILDIVPDIIILIDGQKDCMLDQFNIKKSMYENSTILCSIKIDEDLYEIIKDSNVFFMQNSLELFRDFGFLSGVTVGDIGTDILLRLGAKELYLLGVDASLDSKTGKTHIGTHRSSRKINLNNNSNSINFQNNIIYVKGNLQKTVPTFMEYTEMIEHLSHKLQFLDKSYNIYNLSDGAYFRNTTPLEIKNLPLENSADIDKIMLKDFLLSSLKQINKQQLNALDIKEIQKERKILKKLSSFNKIEDFLKNFKNLEKTISYSIVINILDNYFKLILPYYTFLKNKPDANEILNAQLNKILNDFNSIYDKISNKI
ncbi:motility accessory factor [Arcobacter venerupis]|uniref:Motility accessory factor n=1 Tax=Arcobacter venerupis TaxID=1054033 RepID=A0AAE7E5T4_9BACT|nr:6-hydroxymethylpterin diphosphokinase MptE-like protein [Arcobacter venerupis]QKF68392.1 motility accessory factor [Arcobacter venerupis]RWS49021.1 hypothetical protein CKA56_11415 [Arcobacter venerupis]